MEWGKACKSEEDVKEEERSYLEWVSKYRNHSQEILDQINQWMKDKEYDKLVKLSHSREFVKKYNSIDAIEYFLLAAIIYEQEKKDDIRPLFFEQHPSINEIVDFFTDAKFLLWHMEFHSGENAEEKFVEYIQEQQCSTWAMRFLVKHFSLNKVETLITMAIYDMKYNQLSDAYVFLSDANEIMPGTEMILKSLSEICLKVGKNDIALQWLKAIENPSKNILDKIDRLEN